MRFKVKGRYYRLTVTGWILMTLLICLLMFSFGKWLLNQHHENLEKLDDITQTYRYHYLDPDLPEHFEQLEVESMYQDIRLTSYYIGDSSGSDNMTGSGITIDEFEVNDQGWYLYQDKLVLATATSACTNATTGACAKYDLLKPGFEEYDYFDELVIEIEGIEYPAIVLDSCGASYWPEEHQRYDVFVSNEDSMINAYGKVVRK